MNSKLWNWRLWAGFAVSLLALLSYVFLFQITRSVFWLSLLLFAFAIALLFSGLKRAFAQPESYRGKIAGPILTALSVLVLALFGLATYGISRAFAVAANAPKIGQKAPEFTLVDANHNSVTLAQLLSAPIPAAGATGAAHPPKGVLLVFYRGYW
jgi:hypothetical protein